MWNATPFFTKLLFKASLNQFVLKMPDFKYMLCFFETCWIGGPKLRFLRIDGCAYPFSSNLHPEISAILSSIFLNLRNQVGSAEVASERIAYADCISDCAFTHQKFRLVEIRSTQKIFCSVCCINTYNLFVTLFCPCIQWRMRN